MGVKEGVTEKAKPGWVGIFDTAVNPHRQLMIEWVAHVKTIGSPKLLQIKFLIQTIAPPPPPPHIKAQIVTSYIDLHNVGLRRTSQRTRIRGESVLYNETR